MLDHSIRKELRKQRSIHVNITHFYMLINKHMGNIWGRQKATCNMEKANVREVPRPGEPCRMDLREYACFPYPPPENQGNSVTCVAHAFAMALYCTERLHSISLDENNYPEIASVFAMAHQKSPDRKRGVSFDAIANGLKKTYGKRLAEVGGVYTVLSNNTQQAREVLLRGLPLIVGYQVDKEIDRFHRDAQICKTNGYMLPRFPPNAQSISGHAVLVLGYDYSVQSFICRNSWGPEWGVDGHFLISFATFSDPIACSDVWYLNVAPPSLSS